MKNKEELFSPVYGCVSFNEKEEIKRERISTLKF